MSKTTSDWPRFLRQNSKFNDDWMCELANYIESTIKGRDNFREAYEKSESEGSDTHMALVSANARIAELEEDNEWHHKEYHRIVEVNGNLNTFYRDQHMISGRIEAQLSIAVEALKYVKTLIGPLKGLFRGGGIVTTAWEKIEEALTKISEMNEGERWI